MKNTSSFFSTLSLFVVLTFNPSRVVVCNDFGQCQPRFAPDIEVLKFAMNFEHLEGEFFLYSSLGKGLDSINPALAFGGPPPIGAQRANLDSPVRRIIEEFGYQEVGQLRFNFCFYFSKTTRSIPNKITLFCFCSFVWGGDFRYVIKAADERGIKRPLLNLSKDVFADLFDKVVGFRLDPRFDPYANTTNFLLAANIFPYTGLVGLVGAAPRLTFLQSRKVT